MNSVNLRGLTWYHRIILRPFMAREDYISTLYLTYQDYERADTSMSYLCHALKIMCSFFFTFFFVVVFFFFCLSPNFFHFFGIISNASSQTTQRLNRWPLQKIKRYFNLFALFFLQSYFYVAFSCNDTIVIICSASGNQIFFFFFFFWGGGLSLLLHIKEIFLQRTIFVVDNISISNKVVNVWFRLQKWCLFLVMFMVMIFFYLFKNYDFLLLAFFFAIFPCYDFFSLFFFNILCLFSCLYFFF